MSALTAYRNALRATRIAFNKDTTVLIASRDKIRDGFRAPDLSKPVAQRLKEINEISDFLKQNVVQGTKRPENKYLLNIHKHTELGDNESLPDPISVGGGSSGGCCGGKAA